MAASLLEALLAANNASGGFVVRSPLVGGKLETQLGQKFSIASPSADMMWATGAFNEEAEFPSYHQYARGMRYVDWNDPSEMAFMRCAED